MAMMAYCTGPGSFAKKLSSKNIDYKKEDGDKKVNAVTLYSKKHFGFGGIHPFQYPFYILSVADVAMKIMQGGIGRGEVPGLMSDEDFKTTCQKYPEVKGRIRKRMNKSRSQEIFKRLQVE